MLELTKKDNKVFYKNQELYINKQKSKGPNNEVVDIEGLPESNGQKWISLSKIKDGTHSYECKGKVFTKTSSVGKYSLTEEESQEVETLKNRIDSIIEIAKQRYQKSNRKLEDLSIDELMELINSKKVELEKVEEVEEVEKSL